MFGNATGSLGLTMNGTPLLLAVEEGDPRFVLGTPLGDVTIALLMGVAAVVILLLYGRDLKTRKSRRAGVLWGLRLLGLACLAFVLLEPTLAWKRTLREDVRIAVYVDASASMGLPDKLKDAEARFAIARRNNLLTEDQLQAAEDGKAKAEILTAQQNNVIDNLRRMDIVSDFLKWQNRQFLRRLGEKANVKLHRFGAQVEEISEEALTGNPGLGETLVMEEGAGGGATDVSEALAEVEKLTARERVAAAVLITDGDWNTGKDPVVAASKLQALGIPVFCVGVGNPDEVMDIEVADIKAKKSVYLKDAVAVAAEVRWSGYQDKTVSVSLRQGEDLLQEKKIELSAGARSQTVGLQFVPSRVGVVVCTVGIPPEPDELRSDNNQKTFEVEVTRARKKVLLVEKFPRWEWRFLKNAIYLDPDFDLTTILFNGVGRPSEGDFYLTSFPATKRDLYEFEVIVFGDVPATEFTPEQLQLVASYVDEKGAPFIMISGEQYAPWSYKGTEIEKLLPVLLDDSPRGKTGVYFDEGFNLELTAEGWDSPIMLLSEVPEDNERVWMNMPPSYWCASVERAKPGATVLATHPFLSNRYGKLPLIATQHYGNGKTMIVNIDSTWRWRLEHGDIMHYRFWGNILRWIIATPLEGKGKYVILSSDKETVQLGETVTLDAKVVDKEYYPFQKGEVFVEVTDPFGKTERLPMEMTDARKGMYQVKYPVRAPGVYRIQSAVPALGEEGFQAAINITAESVSLERNSLQMNRDALEGIATKTGGSFHTIETAAAIPDRIPLLQREFSEVKLRSLWDSSYAIIAFVAIMTLEWFLRKRKGYV